MFGRADEAPIAWIWAPQRSDSRIAERYAKSKSEALRRPEQVAPQHSSSFGRPHDTGGRAYVVQFSILAARAIGGIHNRGDASCFCPPGVKTISFVEIGAE
jgi:hypothetical protein